VIVSWNSTLDVTTSREKITMTVNSRLARARIVNSALTIIEDVVYAGLGLILAATAIYLLVSALFRVAVEIGTGSLPAEIIDLLDQVLLILLVVELLYTVKVSLREHTLMAQPFLLVALIATVRKILVLTTQISSVGAGNEVLFRHSMAELGLLSLMMLVLVGSLILLKRHGSSAQEMVDRDPSGVPE
jgi:uncharacterized membrane protein (DUF373 family)